MNCPKCGTNNMEGTKFCSNCGTNLVGGTSKKSFGCMVMDYLKFLLDALIKPFKTYNDKKAELSDNKHVFILTGVVSVAMMLLTLIRSMITICISTNLWTGKTTFELSNLKYLDWVSLIFKNLLIFAAVIYVIAGVYYLATLIIKKEVKYTKLLAIACVSVIPFTAAALFLAPLMAYIWDILMLALFVAGIVYSIMILVCLFREEVKFDNVQTEAFFNLSCLTIILTAGIYLMVRLLLSSASSLVSSIL